MSSNSTVPEEKDTFNWTTGSITLGVVAGGLWMALTFFTPLGTGLLGLIITPFIIGAAASSVYFGATLAYNYFFNHKEINSKHIAEVARDARDLGIKVVLGAAAWTLGAIYLAPVVLAGLGGTISHAAAWLVIGACEAVMVGLANFGIINLLMGKCHKPGTTKDFWKPGFWDRKNLDPVKVKAAGVSSAWLAVPVMLAGAAWAGIFGAAAVGLGEVMATMANITIIASTFLVAYKALPNFLKGFFGREEVEKNAEVKTSENSPEEIEMSEKNRLTRRSLSSSMLNMSNSQKTKELPKISRTLSVDSITSHEPIDFRHSPHKSSSYFSSSENYFSSFFNEANDFYESVTKKTGEPSYTSLDSLDPDQTDSSKANEKTEVHKESKFDSFQIATTEKDMLQTNPEENDNLTIPAIEDNSEDPQHTAPPFQQ